MTWKEWRKALLALVAWREARGEANPTESMRAVMHVANNRARIDGRPIEAVITADGQFTSINPPKKMYDPQLDVWPGVGDPIFTEAMGLADAIIEGSDQADPTGGAYYYWNPRTSDVNGWYARNVAAIKVRTAVIGRHEFYSLENKG